MTRDNQSSVSEIVDTENASKYNQTWTTPNPEDFSSFQKLIYGSLRRPKYPVTYKEWENIARKKVAGPNFNYVFGAASSCRTNAFNTSAFDRYRLRPRMLVNATVRDMSIDLFGKKHNHPLILCPVGVNSIMHKDAEIATAKAAKNLGITYTYSSAATQSIEDVAHANEDGDRWYQIYWPRPQSEEVTVSLLTRAKASGYKVLVVTLDTFNLAWRPLDLNEAYLPFLWGQGCALGFSDPVFNRLFEEQMANDKRTTSEKLKDLWSTMLKPGTPYGALRVLMNAGTLQKSLAWLGVCQSATYREWEHLEILKKIWDGPIVLKGIQTVEDAQKAIEFGMDGIWVSNHGGRQCDGAIASLDALAEIGSDETVKKSGIKIIFDSGVRTGSDVLKALALGADAVGIGRPWMYGLAMGGQEGVEHVLRCILADTDNMLGNAGKKSIKDLSRADLRMVGFEAKL